MGSCGYVIIGLFYLTLYCIHVTQVNRSECSATTCWPISTRRLVCTATAPLGRCPGTTGNSSCCGKAYTHTHTHTHIHGLCSKLTSLCCVPPRDVSGKTFAVDNAREELVQYRWYRGQKRVCSVTKCNNGAFLQVRDVFIISGSRFIA